MNVNRKVWYFHSHQCMISIERAHWVSLKERSSKEFFMKILHFVTCFFIDMNEASIISNRWIWKTFLYQFFHQKKFKFELNFECIQNDTMSLMKQVGICKIFMEDSSEERFFSESQWVFPIDVYIDARGNVKLWMDRSIFFSVWMLWNVNETHTFHLTHIIRPCHRHNFIVFIQREWSHLEHIKFSSPRKSL